MISINKLSFSYQVQQSVLNDLSLDLEERKIHGVVGLNGSGKTTLLNTIFGLIKPDSGSIRNDQQKLTKEMMAYLPAENYFYSFITGGEYLDLFKNKNFDTKKWNELFGLPLGQIIDDYSSGMKKKLAIMGILKQDKPIVILDEPFNNLDVETNRVLHALFKKMIENGKTLILSSHIMETLTKLCDFIHFLEDGKIKMSRGSAEFPAFEEELYKSIEGKTTGLIESLMR